MGTTSQRRRRVACDAVLVSRLHAGDPDAFDELYRRHLPAVTRYVAARMRARRPIIDRDAVDDCVHDAFCDALAAPTLLGADVFGSLLGLASRAVTRHEWARRRYVRTAYTIYEDPTSAAAGAQPPTAPPPAVGQAMVSHALARLSDDQRLAVQLRYLDGHARPMVAALMDRTVHVLRTLERRALHSLQADLATDEPGQTTPAALPARLA